MLQHSLANEKVNRYINEALRALPEHWIRMAGVSLPELGSPLRYLAIGPTGTFIITPTNGSWTSNALVDLERAARAVDRLLPAHDISPTRAFVSCSLPAIRRCGPRCLAFRARAGSGWSGPTTFTRTS
jgi:hypothetical protein